MKNNKLLFIGYQVTNLLFQLFLIPFLYHSISLSDIGEIILLTTISQVLINFISSGASIIGVSRHGEITTSSIFKTQFSLGTLISLMFSFSLFLSSIDNLINIVFSLYVFSSGLSLYWNYIYHERFLKLFVGNVCAKSIFVIFVLLVPVNKLTYSIAISVEYVSLLAFFLLYEKDELLSSNVNKKLISNYVVSSCNRIVSYSSLQLDKLIVSAVFGVDNLAVYNFIYKLVDVPTNLLIQFNYIFMSRMKEIKFLPKIFSIASGITLCLIFVLSEPISYYITDNKILVSDHLLEVSFLCMLVTTRSYSEYISFLKYYNCERYMYPGIAMAISILPYFIFTFYPLDFQDFFLVVALCSVLCVFILNRLDRNFSVDFVFLFLFVYSIVSVLCNIFVTNYVVLISIFFILSIYGLVIFHKALLYNE